MSIRMVLAAAIMGLLMGCSPEYNWRDVTVADGAVKATFPDKPISQERVLNFSGHDIRFILTTAKVRDAVFAVGYASLPVELRGDESARIEVGHAVLRSLYQNLGVAVPKDLPPFEKRFVIEGRSSKEPLKLEAVAWSLPAAVVEGIVTSPTASFPEQRADEFLRSVVVAR